MHLKKITLSGFKSFADRVTINFDRGITGIVGPNGSGKSNVIDAVRWVMGEQSAKHLRGQVATDIIFAGSAKRKSLGMAEVTLIFDNSTQSDFCPPEYRHEPEISLTRRLYSDSSREYLINKKPCRLKDIVSFFATTGLGGRSYSMIQQGQVDRILNAKPEEIREILEEAAGTLIYKTRCAAAQKKLAATRENLTRLEDIVSELDRQQKSLAGQVEKARKWKELNQELRTRELSLFAHNYHHFNDLLEKSNAEFAVKNADNEAIKAAMAELEVRLTGLQDQLDAADPDLEGLHEQVSSIREDIARAESTIMNANSLLEHGQKRFEQLDTEVKADAENMRELEQQVQAASEELSTAAQRTKDLQDQIDSFQDEVDAVDESARVFASRIEDCADQLKNIDRLLDSNTIRCEAIGKDRQRISTESEEIERRLEQLSSDLRAAEMQASSAKERAAESQQGLDVELARKQELETEVTQGDERLRFLREQRDSLRESYLETRARVSSLQELIESASDVGGALEKLRQQAPEVEGIVAGVLTDFIGFNDQAEGLSRNAAGAFERWAERLIVSELDSLNDLVRLAHKVEVGGMPITVLSELSASDSAACAAWADRVDAEPLRSYLKVANAPEGLNALLDRLYYLPTLALSTLESQPPAGVVAFSSQGVITSGHGEFFVGSKGSKGVLSRKTELESLTAQLKDLEKELAGVQVEVDDLDVMQKTARAELQELSARLQTQNRDVMAIMADLQAATQILQHKKEIERSANQQLEVLRKADHEATSELAELGQARISLGEERETTEAELTSLEEQSATIEDQRAEVFRVHQARKVELAKAETRAQSLEQNFRQNRMQLERVQAMLSRRYDERSRLELEIEEAVKNKAEAEQSIHEKILLREQLETDLAEKREENAAILADMRALEQQLKERRERQFVLQRRVTELDVEIERERMIIAGVVQQAAEKYQVDLARHEFERDSRFDPDSSAKEVQKIRVKVESMGAINMLAIEEYEVLMERTQFIHAQREEVISSINLLEEALEEIEETSRKKFAETFTTINLEFGNLFPILFPGGEASLQMTNPNDPLNSGVDILCRLPGKKQQRMNLFSGGEKALTAISLIFALLKTKPTPFCFLDEVDAPLDEANVGRYNRVLEALSERFQFIVITHNRRTMEVLDTLYGVTMQEPGVSKVVGVDLQKDLPEHLRRAFKENKGQTDRKIEGATLQGLSAESQI